MVSKHLLQNRYIWLALDGKTNIKIVRYHKNETFSSVEMCSGKDVYCEQIIYHFPEKKFFFGEKNNFDNFQHLLLDLNQNVNQPFVQHQSYCLEPFI
jgi:hypothetical protein